MKHTKNIVLCLLTFLCCICCQPLTSSFAASSKITLNNIPTYSDQAYIELNNNVPSFKRSDLKTKAFEKYSELDDKGRCGIAFANVCSETMPTEKRGSIGMIKPSGWQTVKYDFIDGKYLYNRCHLIGYQLTGENANEKNLITGTRYLNIEGMLPFENQVADYVRKTDNHVLYRATPVFENDNLLANGVQLEAYSVEDKGKGVSFNVFCYNVQPGVDIDYSDGSSNVTDNTPKSISLNYKKYTLTIDKSKTLVATVSPSPSSVKWYSSNNKVATVSKNGKVTAKKAGTAIITVKTENGLKAQCKITVKTESITASSEKHTYVLNTSTKKIHRADCTSVADMKESNKAYTNNYTAAISSGYDPCKRCNPV